MTDYPFGDLFELLEESMKKATKPLRNTRAQTQKIRDPLLEKREKAQTRYPFHEISERLDIKISPRAKRMALRVDPKDGNVKLVIPKRASIRSAYEFALKNADWIEERVSEIPEGITFEHGVTIPVLGQKRKINISYDSALKRTDIILKDNELFVSTNKEDPSSRIKRFLIDLAKTELSAMAHQKAELIDKHIDRIDVKDTVSRWGSCSHDAKLSLSWRLILAPYDAMDYVVAHEVAHLVHMDHSPAFWKVCAALSKSYAKGKKWMTKNGSELMRYGA